MSAVTKRKDPHRSFWGLADRGGLLTRLGLDGPRDSPSEMASIPSIRRYYRAVAHKRWDARHTLLIDSERPSADTLRLVEGRSVDGGRVAPVLFAHRSRQKKIPSVPTGEGEGPRRSPWTGVDGDCETAIQVERSPVVS